MADCTATGGYNVFASGGHVKLGVKGNNPKKHACSYTCFVSNPVNGFFRYVTEFILNILQDGYRIALLFNISGIDRFEFLRG